MPSRPAGLELENQLECVADALDIDFSVPMTHRLRFTNDCFGAEFDVLRELLQPSAGRPSRVQVWVDQGLIDWDAELSRRVERQFSAAQELELASEIKPLIGGEAVKNDPDIIHGILGEFDKDHLDRRSYVLAIGGGAFLDAVGYAAAIAHRGIRLVRFPTTTLAQSDSGVGVKNAVNYFGKKNWKGTFAVPWAVINDARLLEGLSDRDYRCGFAEAVKVALLKAPKLFDYLVTHATEIAARQRGPSQYALKQSVLLHLHHITRGGDPFEMLQARPLDFGHWSAHKLEALSDYELRHGEAVAIGVALDAAYSYLTLGLPLKVAEKTFAALRGLQLPIWDRRLEEQGNRQAAVFEGLEEFRQHLGGELTITLIRDVGSPVNVHDIRISAMKEAFEMVRHYAGADRIKQSA